MRILGLATLVSLLVATMMAALMSSSGAAPEVSNSVIALSLGTQSNTLHLNPLSAQFAVSVSLQAGSATIEGQTGQTWTELGVVSAGKGCVFEGAYAAMRATGSSAAGVFTVRAPTDVAHADDLVGVLESVAVGGLVRVFHSAEEHNRHLKVTALTNTIQIMDESGLQVVLEIDQGDSVLVHDECNSFWLKGIAAVASVRLYDAKETPPAGAGTEGEVHGGKDGDSDPVYRGPAAGEKIQCVEIAFLPNPYPSSSKGKVTIKYKYKGGTDLEFEVDPGDTVPPVKCELVSVDVEFAKKGDTLRWKRTKMTATH